MIPTWLGKLFDSLHIRTGEKQVARVTGGGSITQLQARGDINVDKVLVVDVSALPELQALKKRVEELELHGAPPTSPALPGPAQVEIDADVISIIKAYDLEGSRLHLAFQVRNTSDETVTVTGATLTVNGCALGVKQFYVDNGQVRVPDPTTFPIAVLPKSATPMSIEFENPAASIVYTNGIEAELRLGLDPGTATERFVLDGQQAELVHVLGQMQKLVDARKTAYPLDVPVARRVSAKRRP